MACQDLTPGLAPSQHPCMQPHFTPTSSPPTSLHLVAISILAKKLSVRHVLPGLASVDAKASATLHILHYSSQCQQSSVGPPPEFESSHPPLGNLSQMALVVPSFNTPLHPRCSPPPPVAKERFVCGACTGTAQIGTSLVAPLGFIFKRSSLRSLRDMIIIYKERKK